MHHFCIFHSCQSYIFKVIQRLHKMIIPGQTYQNKPQIFVATFHRLFSSILSLKMPDNLFIMDHFDHFSKHFIQQPPLLSSKSCSLNSAYWEISKESKDFINKHVKKKSKGQTTTDFLYFKKLQNIQDTCFMCPGGFEWPHDEVIHGKISSPKVLWYSWLAEECEKAIKIVFAFHQNKQNNPHESFSVVLLRQSIKELFPAWPKLFTVLILTQTKWMSTLSLLVKREKKKKDKSSR